MEVRSSTACFKLFFRPLVLAFLFYGGRLVVRCLVPEPRDKSNDDMTT